MMYKLVLLCVIALVAIIPLSFSVTTTQCHQCEYFDHYNSNATNNEKCKQNPPPADLKNLVNCSGILQEGQIWQCAKVTGRIEVNEENFNIVQRFCQPGNVTAATCKETKSYQTRHGFIKRGSHCLCEGDGCNAGSSLAFKSATLGMGLIAILLFTQM